MLLLQIVNKSVLLHNITIHNYIKQFCNSIDILNFAKKETFTFFTRWLLLLIFINLYTLKVKTNSFVSYLYFSFFNHQKLVSYIISINLFSINTFININNIKGNPKYFCSAGMVNLQKKQKTRQPKAIILILRALLLKSKIWKTKPVAIHFNNIFFNHQSYIFKRLKRKIFAKLVINYCYRSHNGCRLKKKKRIKIRTRAK